MVILSETSIIKLDQILIFYTLKRSVFVSKLNNGSNLHQNSIFEYQNFLSRTIKTWPNLPKNHNITTLTQFTVKSRTYSVTFNSSVTFAKKESPLTQFFYFPSSSFFSSLLFVYTCFTTQVISQGRIKELICCKMLNHRLLNWFDYLTLKLCICLCLCFASCINFLFDESSLVHRANSHTQHTQKSAITNIQKSKKRDINLLALACPIKINSMFACTDQFDYIYLPVLFRFFFCCWIFSRIYLQRNASFFVVCLKGFLKICSIFVVHKNVLKLIFL